MNNLLLAASIVASLSGSPADAATPLDVGGVDAFDMTTLVAANTRMHQDAISDADLAVCTTVGDFACLMTAAGYETTDAELAADAAANAA